MTTAKTTAKAPDHDEIVRVVHLYIDGFKGNISKFKEAFHKDAWIFYLDADGVFHNGLLADRFEQWAASNRHAEGRVLSVTQVGDVASVFLEYDNYIDCHTLLRIDGIWKITNKTATHSSRIA